MLIDSLERLRGERTIILIAQRLSTVHHCDTILYIEDGQIAASGTYEQLQRDSDGFRALAHGT